MLSKKKLLLIALASIPSFTYHAQQPLNTDAFEWYCSFDGSELPSDLYGFASDNAASSALSQVLRHTGLAQNFVIQAANVDNAVAVVNENDRYILYNQDFMLRIADVERDWAAISVLAHEVGHHLQGHTLQPGGSRPPIELEADQYSGFVLQRMGASLDQAQAAMKSLAPDYGSDTHPGRSARLAAITNGWVSSCELGLQAGDDGSACRVSVPDPIDPPPRQVEQPSTGSSSSGGELDYSLEAYFGEVELEAGFIPDPYTLDVTSGGSVDASYIGGECRGYAAEAPDFQLTWSGDSSLLRILFAAEGGVGDTTLLVNLPNGDWVCNDDGPTTGLDPVVSIDYPAEGVFDIWVGSYSEGENVQGTLSVTELED